MIRPRWQRISVAFWLACVVTTEADESQVNTYTTGNQNAPSVGLAADGAAVVVWASDGSSGTDASGGSIQGQRYAPDGTAVGGEFQINTYTSASQRDPSVAVDASGAFVVVWRIIGTGPEPIRGQRYASDGSATGGEFEVSTDPYYTQRNPAVELQPSGDFVVVWESFEEGYGYFNIHLRRFSSDGSPLSSEIAVPEFRFDEQGEPSVAVAEDGDFVVVWHGMDLDYGYDVQARRFSSDGSAAGSQFQINNHTTGHQWLPSVAVGGNGEFVVVWRNEEEDSYGSMGFNVYGRRLASDGSFVGAEFQASTTTPNFFSPPTSVAIGPADEFIVAWANVGSTGDDTSSTSILARRYASDGSALNDEEFQVNTYTTGVQNHVVVESADNGEFVAVWRSSGSGGTDSSMSSVQIIALGGPIFADGFESGDLTAWSLSVP